MILVQTTYTVKSPSPRDVWTRIGENNWTFGTMADARAFVKEQYYYCKKRVPCYVDRKNGARVQTGHVYCFVEKEDGKTYYRQDWVCFSELTPVEIGGQL